MGQGNVFTPVCQLFCSQGVSASGSGVGGVVCLWVRGGRVAASGSGGCLSLGPGGVYHMPPGHTPSGHTSPLVHNPDTPLHTHTPLDTPSPDTHTPGHTPHGWIHTHTPDTPLEAHPPVEVAIEANGTHPTRGILAYI